MRDLWETMSPEERRDVLSVEDRLKGLSPEELMGALAPDQLERLRQLLQTQTRADDSSRRE